MIVEGTAYWASVRQPNTTFEPMYTINLVVDEEVAKDFAARGHSIREMEEGPAIVIKRKVNGPNGMGRGKHLDFLTVIRTMSMFLSVMALQLEFSILNMTGSIIRKGKGLDLQAVQIVNLVPYKGGDGDELLSDEEF